MSGIFGFFQRDGAPLSTHTLQRMQDAMAEWGPDGHNFWVKDNIGLGSCLLFNTPEALYEQLPYQDPSGQWVISSEARLDNRDELCDHFAIETEQRAQLPDSRLILMAYQRWGEECVKHLFGDWSFALWNKLTQTLFLARDHRGHTAFYYVLNDQFCAFASSQKALLSLDKVPKEFNEEKLADIIARWANGNEHTIYKNIKHLLTAHTLTISKRKASKKRYWYPENQPLLKLKSQDEYAEGLLEVLTQATDSCLRSYRPVGISLSGGLDSGSVAVLAAKKLRESKPQQSLQAFTYIPYYKNTIKAPKGRIRNELALVEKIAQKAGNINVQTITAEHISPLKAMRQLLSMGAEPDNSYGNAYWLQDIRQQCQQQKLGVLLTGQAGNFTISYAGKPALLPWGTLLQQGDWKTMLRHKPKSLIPEHLRQLLISRNNKSNRDTNFSLISPDLCKRTRLTERMQAVNFHRSFSHPHYSDPKTSLWSLIQPGNDSSTAHQAQMAAPYGLEMRDPTLDVRVMEYCLSIPDHMFIGPNGENRYLIRKAMDSYLPETVRWNTMRGFQNIDFVQRLLASQTEIEEQLEIINSYTDSLSEYMDVTQAKSLWTHLKQAQNISRREHAKALRFYHFLSVSMFILNL